MSLRRGAVVLCVVEGVLGVGGGGVLYFYLTLKTFSTVVTRRALSLDRYLRVTIRGGLSLRGDEGRVTGKGCSVDRGRTGLLPRVGTITRLGSGFAPPISIASNSTCNGPCGMAGALRCGTSTNLRLRVPLCGRVIGATVSVTGVTSRLGRLSCRGTHRSLVIRATGVCCVTRGATRRVHLIGSGVGHLRRLCNVAGTFCSGRVDLRISIGHIGLGVRGLAIRHSGTVTVLSRRCAVLGCIVSCPTRERVGMDSIGPKRVRAIGTGKLGAGLCRLRLLRGEGRLTRGRAGLTGSNCLPSIDLAKDLVCSTFASGVRR